MYDIIYSVLIHEAPECIIDMIENIKYFNKGIKFAIIFHANPTIFGFAQTLTKKYDNVFVNSDVTVKKLYTYSILDGHIKNIEYCVVKDIRAKYIVLLASNCMFWKPITLETVDDFFAKRTPFNPEIYKDPTTDNTWHWPLFFKNHELVQRLKDIKMKYFVVLQHEGAIIDYDTAMQMMSQIKCNLLNTIIKVETTFEEILVPSMIVKLTGYNQANMCKVFWEIDGSIPSIEQIKACSLPCVKIRDRDYNSEVRIWLRSIGNNYSVS